MDAQEEFDCIVDLLIGDLKKNLFTTLVHGCHINRDVSLKAFRLRTSLHHEKLLI